MRAYSPIDGKWLLSLGRQQCQEPSQAYRHFCSKIITNQAQSLISECHIVAVAATSSPIKRHCKCCADQLIYKVTQFGIMTDLFYSSALWLCSITKPVSRTYLCGLTISSTATNYANLISFANSLSRS